MLRIMKVFIILLTVFLASCGTDDTKSLQNTIKIGEQIFIKNCQVCHGVKAAGIYPDWKKTLADGSYPPPPLNGTAHTWHHSPKMLIDVINEGGERVGGQMPPFKDVLTDSEKYAVLDYLQSLWPQDIKDKYDKRFK